MLNERIDLLKLIPPGSIAVELGVAKGEFSAELLEHGKENINHLYSIDRWSDHHGEDEFMEAKKRLAKFRGRTTIMRYAFREAALCFADGAFDFIYIDGYAHTGQEGGRTLEDWWPLLKSGGLFAGHDYCPQFKPTMDAVDEFAAKHGLNLEFTEESGPMNFPSWYCFKS